LENVLIIGGTGFLGKFIVFETIKNNFKVRVVTRDKEKAIKLFGTSVEYIEGSIQSQNILEKAIEDISCIIVTVSAFNRKQIRKVKEIELTAILNIFNIAKSHQIQRIIYLSVFEKPAKNINIIQGKLKRELENYLELSSFNYTILGIPPSIEMFFALKKGNKLIAPGGGPPILPTIAPQDIGKIVTKAILIQNLEKRRFRLVGPDCISFKEASKKLSSVYGESIKYQKIPLLPIRIVSFITNLFKPIFPYLSEMTKLIILMNEFPKILENEVSKDLEELVKIFNYEPTTLEEYAITRGDINNISP
jgi:uncharacterized protein YbjT (DUF2867 family)